MAPTDTVLTVLIDSREQYPLLFPATYLTTDLDGRPKTYTIRTHTRKLDAGDYRLSDSSACIIERKGSVSELAKNLFDTADRARTAKALSRLAAACPHPYIIAEVSPQSLLTGHPDYSPHVYQDPQLLMDKLVRASLYKKVQLILVPKPTTSHSRRALGTFCLSLLINHLIMDNPNTTKETSTNAVE